MAPQGREEEADPGIFGTLTSILVGGVTELLTDFSPQPPSSTGRGGSGTNPHRRRSRSPSPEPTSAGSRDLGARADFAPFAADAALAR